MTEERLEQVRSDLRARLVAGDPRAIEALLYWIRDDELLSAAESVGVIRAGTGILMSPKEIANEALSILKRRLK